MKKIHVLFAVLFICSCVRGFSQVDLHKGLQAYYPFSGNANDWSDNNRDATVVSATLTADHNGNANSAYYFDGETAVIKNVDFSTASYTAITLSCWIETDKTSPQATIIQKGSGVMYANLLSGKKLCSAFDGTSSNNSSSDASATDVVTGNWVHVVATNDGTTTRQYINGVYENGYAETYSATTNGLFIGSQVNGMWGFKGSIDEVYIYNRAINADEVSALYNGGLSGVGPVVVKNEAAITVYPNPASGRQVTLDMKRSVPGSVISVYTPEGKQVYTSPMTPAENGLQYKLDLNGLPAGVYILLLRSGDLAVTRRIVLL